MLIKTQFDVLMHASIVLESMQNVNVLFKITNSISFKQSKNVMYKA